MTTQSNERIWGRNFILAMLANGTVLAVFLAQTTTVGLYARGMGASDLQIGLTATVTTLAALCFRPLVGWMLDHQGRTLTLLIGIVSLAAGSILTNWAATLPMLFLFGALRGAAFSFTSTACVTLATDAIPHTRLSEGFGYYSLAAILASAVGPGVGLTVAQGLGFPAFWVGSGAMVALASILTFFLRSPHDAVLTASKAHVDPTSTQPAPPPAQRLSLKAGILVPSTLNLLLFIAFSSLLTFLPLFTVSRHIPNGGLFFTLQSVGTLLIRLFGSKLGERHGYRRMLLVFLPLMAIAFVTITMAWNLPVLLLAALLYGVGNGVVQPLYTATLMIDCSPGLRGKANALFLAASDIGLSVGSVLLGSISGQFGFPAVYLTAAGFIVLQFALVTFTKAVPGRIRTDM